MDVFPDFTLTCSTALVAGAVVFLASPASSLVTDTTLMVDGGWTAR